MRATDTTLACFAVNEEAKFFRPLVRAHPWVQVLITGMGRRNAERSTRVALTSLSPKRVVSAGFAGGLRSGLASGTVVFSGAAGTGWEPALLRSGAQQVSFHFADRVATSAQEKRKLREITGADAIEMESRVICDLCAERHIPSAIIRVILDTAEEDLALDFNEVLNAEQQINGWKLAGLLLKSPGKIVALLRLRKQSESAARQLARVLGAVLQWEQGQF